MTRLTDQRIGIVGLGYVGLPVCLEFVRAGLQVVGVDIDRRRVEMLRQGRSYISDVTDDQVAAAREAFEPTDDFGRLADCSAIIISVPTPLAKTGEPDISAIINSTSSIGEILGPGQLVILESTTYPGTTEDIVRPLLEEKSGLRAGEDFNLAYSPERISPGDKWSFADIPKLVGGLTDACTQRAAALYRKAIRQVVTVSSPRVAEMAKLLENAFRAVNIALVNELALMCRRMGISVWEVIDAAATKPFGFMRFEPGPGVGGHCIPVDPIYLAWRARQFNHEARFIQVADVINRSMPEHVLRLVCEALNDHGKPLRDAAVLAIGVAYKPGVGDCRESPALDVIDLLVRWGASVSYHDPYVPELQHNGRRWRCIELTQAALADADCVVILTAHPDYDWRWIVENARLVVDTRGATRHLDADNVVLL